MIIYWIVWLSVIIFGSAISRVDYPYDGVLTKAPRKHTKAAKRVYLFVSLMLILCAGCRYRVGADFGAYYAYWRYLDFWPALRALDEPGIRLIYNIAIRVHESSQFCIFCVAAVTLGLELAIIYHNTDRLYFAIILFTFMCWTSCFNGVRQALAVAVLFCGYPALRDKDIKRYALFVFLAFLCHRSAIVMILIYFIANREVNTKNVIILIAATAIVLLSYGRVYQVVNIVLENEVTGAEAYWSTRVNRLRPLTRVAPALFFLYVYRRKEKTHIASFYLNLLLISAVVSVTTMNSAALSRMSMYMSPFVVVALVELVKVFPQGKQKRVSSIIVMMYWGVAFFENSRMLFNFQCLRWIW